MSDYFDMIDNVDDTYSMALMMISASSDIPEYSLLSELVYLLDHDSFINILKYYEGQTIKIPTKEELQNSFRLLMLFSYFYVEKCDWNVALDKAGFSPDESRIASLRLTRFVKRLRNENYKLKGVLPDEGDD